MAREENAVTGGGELAGNPVSSLLSVLELSECVCLCVLIRFVKLFTLP